MQAINLPRSLFWGLQQTEVMVFLFDGTPPTSLDQIPFDYYNSRACAENCLGRLDGCQINVDGIITDANNKPIAIQPRIVNQATFTKEFFIGPSDLDGEGVPRSFTFPGISYNNARSTSNEMSWFSMRNDRFLTVDGLATEDCGTNGAWLECYFGSEKTISGCNFRQINDVASRPGGGSVFYYNSYARETDISPIFKDAEGNYYHQFAQRFNTGLGFNRMVLDTPVTCWGFRLTAARGTGASSGVGGTYAWRAEWRVQYAAAFHEVADGGSYGASRSPTWALCVFLTPANYGFGPTDVSGSIFSYGADTFQLPVAIVDVSAPGAGGTLQPIQYPMEPGVSPQINKFNFNISS